MFIETRPRLNLNNQKSFLLKIKGSAATPPFQSQSIRFAERITCAALHCRMPELLCNVKKLKEGILLLFKQNKMNKSIEKFLSEEIKLDKITGGNSGTATGDTCSNNVADDCDAEKVPVIVIKG